MLHNISHDVFALDFDARGIFGISVINFNPKVLGIKTLVLEALPLHDRDLVDDSASFKPRNMITHKLGFIP